VQIGRAHLTIVNDPLDGTEEREGLLDIAIPVARSAVLGGLSLTPTERRRSSGPSRSCAIAWIRNVAVGIGAPGSIEKGAVIEPRLRVVA